MKHVMNTYARLPINLVKGSGCTVWDDQGREYLDMMAGIAVCNLGHAHPAVVKALQKQASELFHCSNLYGIPQQFELARLISESTFDAQVFFCNSGAEANEAAIKLVRRYTNTDNDRGCKIITVKGSFHGRTLATVAATGQEKFKQGFNPIPAGFIAVEYGDINALEAAIDDEVAAIMLEPILGESGVRVPVKGYLQQIRQLCNDHNILLVLDEVQTGMGRTGKLFGYMHDEIEPDIMTVAKALGNGFPVGALVAKPSIAAAFTPGTHGSTFGGNPLAMSCGLATLQTMLREEIPEKSMRQGLYLRDQLNQLKAVHPSIKEIRGKGLMVGVEFDADISYLTKASLDSGMLVNVIKERILRFVPPLIISMKEIDRAVNTLDGLLKDKGL